MITDMKAYASSQNLKATALNLQTELLAAADKKKADYDLFVKLMQNVVKTDPKLESVQTFKTMIKAFTTEALYGRIGRIMFNGRYEKL